MSTDWTLLAYHVYILPVVLFVAQLEKVPPRWEDCEIQALQKLLPGPKHWFQADGLRSLRLLGFPKAVPELHEVSIAIRFRVATRENAKNGGLHVATRAARLLEVLRTCGYWPRLARWSDWIQSSALISLDEAVAACSAKGVTTHNVEDAIAGDAERPWTVDVHRKVQRQWQRHDAGC